MFDKPYRLHGRHAKESRELLAEFDSTSRSQLFRYAKDVYVTAPIVGFLYNRRADLDHTKNPETNEEYDQNIMAEQVLSVQEDLTFHFCLIMLLDTEYEPDENKRIDKAFRNVGKVEEDEDRFDEYVRGGIDVLYEKLVEGKGDPEDYANRIYDFIDEVNERYNTGIDLDVLIKQCIN